MFNHKEREMATVSRIKLKIGDEDRNNRRLVTVTYRVCFSRCEAMAGSVFREKVTLRGDDPIWDDHLITLRNTCLKSTSGCIDRKVSRRISSSTLDEDADTIILGWVIGNKDEVYARVALTPFEPSSTRGDSNTISADFGPAGS
ncbi:hypothetical protein AB833_10320 [Chromatiales bacterium (ex Bugula neritina AB1)]|nr:hypothetical protein AB833_10320 [Chromatiales bacterium (ex Bugula neritina AB1)]